jgi:hypothetical protein
MMREEGVGQSRVDDGERGMRRENEVNSEERGVLREESPCLMHPQPCPQLAWYASPTLS